MGFVSAIVINNDLLSDIADDKDFGEKTSRAILSLTFRAPECSIFSGPGVAATAVACHHASTGVPIIVGGGTFYKAIRDIHLSENSQDLELELLKNLAEKHGFNLHKKRSK